MYVFGSFSGVLFLYPWTFQSIKIDPKDGFSQSVYCLTGGETNFTLLFGNLETAGTTVVAKWPQNKVVPEIITGGEFSPWLLFSKKKRKYKGYFFGETPSGKGS